MFLPILIPNQLRYTCVASNEAGKAQNDYVVEVLIKPKLRRHNANVQVLEGNITKLGCVVEAGNPKPTISWLRGGRPIAEMTNLTNFIISPRGDTLTIVKARRADM